MDKFFFIDVRSNLIEGGLQHFTKKWKGSTIFSLKQLACLYDVETKRTKRTVSHCEAFLFTMVLTATWVSLFVLGLQHGNDILGSLVLSLFVALFGAVLATLCCSPLLQRVERYHLSHGIPGGYRDELWRFSEALHFVCTRLNVTLHDLVELSSEDLGDRVLKYLFGIAETIRMAEAGLNYSCGSAEYAQGNIRIGELRNEFRQAYDTYALLGLARGGYGNYFRVPMVAKSRTRDTPAEVESA